MPEHFDPDNSKQHGDDKPESVSSPSSMPRYIEEPSAVNSEHIREAEPGTGIKDGGIGLLSAAEFRSRRSESLLNNPEARLDEEYEVRAYFERLDGQYVGQITQLADLDHTPMQIGCRMVVTVIAYGEGPRIKRTLEQYTGQAIDPKLYEIIVLDNHPAGVEDDNTAIEVEKFMAEHPEINVTFAHKTWREGEPATLGNARRHAFDTGLARILARGPNGKDTIVVSNDADTRSIEPNYLSGVLNEFDSCPEVDALVTRTELPPDAWAKPNLAAAVSLWDALDRTIAMDDVGDPKDRTPEPAMLIGRSNAMRASIYAAVGGHNAANTSFDDTEMTWMISDARDWDARSIIQFDDTSLTTDPRRYLLALAHKVPVSEMFSDFHHNTNVRAMNNDEVLALIPDTFDWEQFQDDADSFWQSQDTGMYRRLGKRFDPLFKRAMDKVGADYEIVENALVVTNADRLLQSLAHNGREIEVIHSQLRTVDTAKMREIKEHFFGISRPVLEAWSTKAEGIANDILTAEHDGDTGKLRSLRSEYAHYAGHEYKAA